MINRFLVRVMPTVGTIAACMIISIVTSALCSSCSSKENDYSIIVSEWQGKEIIFPGAMTDVITGDTIDLSEADFTILTYVDSTGCTSCKLKLPIWKDIIASFDTISDYNIAAIMVVHTKNEQEIRDLLKNDVYNYPVYADTKDCVNALNTFPTDIRCNTFLLDKSHHVLAIGNPTYSPGITVLFKSILSGSRTLDTAFRQDVTLSDNNADLHKLSPGETVLYETRLTNNGPDTVYLDKIVNSCDCMASTIEKNYIAPHDGLNVSIKLTADSSYGEFSRSAYIYYKGFDYPSVINLHGDITDSK